MFFTYLVYQNIVQNECNFRVTIFILQLLIIDAHRLKIQGRGYLMFFAKIPREVKDFRKNCRGGPPISGFIVFLLTSVQKFAWGVLYLPSPFPLTPLCASMFVIHNVHNVNSSNDFTCFMFQHFQTCLNNYYCSSFKLQFLIFLKLD